MQVNAEANVKSNKKPRYTNIPLNTLVHIAWKNLVSKKLRTFLTLFGVIIGIGSIFFLLSFGLGLRDLVSKQVIGNQSINSIDVNSTNSKIVKLDETNANKIKQLPHISKIGLNYSLPASLKLSGSEIDVVAYGDDQVYQQLSGLSVSSGRLLNDNDTGKILINQSAAEAIGIKDVSKAVGKSVNVFIPLKNLSSKQDSIQQSFNIVGVVDSRGGSEVYLPSYVFEFAGVKDYTQFKLVIDSSRYVSSTRKQIEALGFQTSSPADTIDQINQIFKFFNFILFGFGAIGMIIAVLGMFNTLTISLLERTKEIGLMIALGGRNRDMSKLFIFEAVLLSFVGAIVGILIAFINGIILNKFMNNFAHHRGVQDNFNLFATPLWLIASLTGFMVLVGLIVAFFPAQRAKHINPIDALRRE